MGRQTFEITIPGLSMRSDFAAVRHRLRADFPGVIDVLAMTTPSTVQVVYAGPDEVNAWIEALGDSVATRRMSFPGPRTDGAPGDGLASWCRSCASR